MKRDPRDEGVRPLLPLLRRAEARVVSAVEGGSMGEKFAAGSAIRIESRVGQSFAVGDVVAVAYGDGILAHRVVHVGSGRRTGYFITKGDARKIPDCPVHRDDIVGGVTEIRMDDEWRPLPIPPDTVGRDPWVGIIQFLFERHLPSATLAAKAAHLAYAVAAKLRRRLLWWRDPQRTGGR
jgi:signal peptidase I